MREILFKAKRTDTGEWVEGYIYRQPPSIQMDGISHWWIHVPPVDPDDKGGVFNVDPETVVQYTGMNDKNGKKIFDGDRIRFVTWEEDVMERAVCWDQEHGRFCVWLNGAVTVGVNRYLSDDIEVIGNIHDKEDSHA